MSTAVAVQSSTRIDPRPVSRRARPQWRVASRRVVILVAVALGAGGLIHATSLSTDDLPAAAAPLPNSEQDSRRAAQTTAQPATRLAEDELERSERLAELRRAMVARVDALRVELNLPGAVLAIVKEDEPLLVAGFGHASVSGEGPLDESSFVRLGPVAETMVAVLAAIEADTGGITFRTPLIRGMPRVRLRTGALSQQATLAALLGHRAGIGLDDALWSVAPDASSVLSALADAAASDDGRVRLSASSVFAAATLMAEIQGTDPVSLLRARLLDPLGMGSTGFDIDALDPDGSRRAHGHERVDGAGVVPSDAWPGHGAALRPVRGMWSTASDLVAYLRLLGESGRVGDARLVSRERLGETFRRDDEQMLSDLADRSMTQGWVVERWQGHDRLGRFGHEAGQAAAIAYVPSMRTALIVVINIDDVGAAESIADAALALAAGVEPRGHDDGALDGTYRADPGGPTFEVRTRDGSLTIDLPAVGVVPLLPPATDGRRHGVAGDMVILGPASTPDEGVFVDGEGRFAVLRRHGLPTLIGSLDDQVRAIGDAAARHRVGDLLNIYRDEAGDQRIEIALGSGGGPCVLVGGQVPLTLVPARQPDARDEWIIPTMRSVRLTVERHVDGTLAGIRIGSDTAAVHLRPELPLADPDPRRAASAILARRAAGPITPMTSGLRLAGSLRIPSQGLRVGLEIEHRPEGMLIDAAVGPFGRLSTTAYLAPGQRPRGEIPEGETPIAALIMRPLLDAALLLERHEIVESGAEALLLGQTFTEGVAAARILVVLAGTGGADDLPVVLHLRPDNGGVLAIELPDAGPLFMRPTRVESIGGAPTVLEAEIRHPTLGTMLLVLAPTNGEPIDGAGP